MGELNKPSDPRKKIGLVKPLIKQDETPRLRANVRFSSETAPVIPIPEDRPVSRAADHTRAQTPQLERKIFTTAPVRRADHETNNSKKTDNKLYSEQLKQISKIADQQWGRLNQLYKTRPRFTDWRNRYLTSKNLRTIALSWTLPVLLAAAIFFGVHARVNADPPPDPTELEQYLQSNELQPYGGIADEYPQIFYFFNHQPVQVTTSRNTHLHPVSSGPFVSWIEVINGQAQIFQYNVLTTNLMQLSLLAPNEGAYAYQDKVVWQGWDGSHWQIHYYDGAQVQQITNSDETSSFRPAINGSQIIYAEQLGQDDWKAQSYDLATHEVTTIGQGDTPSTAYPHFTSSGVETAFTPR